MQRTDVTLEPLDDFLVIHVERPPAEVGEDAVGEVEVVSRRERSVGPPPSSPA